MYTYNNFQVSQFSNSLQYEAQSDQEAVNVYKPVLKKIIQLIHFATLLTTLRADTLTILNVKLNAIFPINMLFLNIYRYDIYINMFLFIIFFIY